MKEAFNSEWSDAEKQAYFDKEGREAKSLSLSWKTVASYGVFLIAFSYGLKEFTPKDIEAYQDDAVIELANDKFGDPNKDKDKGAGGLLDFSGYETYDVEQVREFFTKEQIDGKATELRDKRIKEVKGDFAIMSTMGLLLAAGGLAGAGVKKHKEKRAAKTVTTPQP